MASAPQVKVQLFLKAKGLADEDTFSKSDPYVVIYDANAPSAPVGRTEVIQNSINPVFKTPVVMTYFFEIRQQVRVELWDKDTRGKDDFLGKAEFTMGSLMSAKDATLTLKLDKKGTVTVTGAAVGTDKGLVSFGFEGTKLKNMDLIGKSDPYFILSRILPSGEKKMLYKSEVISNTLEPKWKPVPQLSITALCGGDREARCIRFDCFDEDLSSDDPMGGFTATLTQLLEPGSQYELNMEKKGKQKSYGFIRVVKNDFVRQYGFTDFLRGGMQINIAFAIDFTGSNGPCTDQRSLHFYHPTQPNNYINAMLAVSNVVQDYDSDRMFPAYGFGAVTPQSREVSHFFPLSGDPSNAYLQGMQSVVNAYATILPQLHFSGPTNFAPSIQAITQGARQAPNVYTILLILTDGAITDMQDTLDTLVDADDAPVSILIVGIGNADFSSMSRLDGDGMALQSRRGKKSRRDVVQFVPMRDFASKAPEQLAAALLEEIPAQVERWAEITGYKPPTV